METIQPNNLDDALNGVTTEATPEVKKIDQWTITEVDKTTTAPMTPKQIAQKKAKEYREYNENRKEGLNGMNLTTFEFLASSFDGLKPSFIFVPARENVGKSVFCVNLAIDILDSNDDAQVLLVTIDDPFVDMYGLFSAHFADLRRDEITRPKKYPEAKKGYNETDKLIRDDKLLIVDGEEITKYNHIEDLVKQRKELSPDKKLVLIVDGCYDLPVEDGVKDSKSKHEMQAKQLHRIFKENRVCVVATGELSKAQNEKEERTPSKHHITETRNFLYKPSAIILMYRKYYEKQVKDKSQRNRNGDIFKEDNTPDQTVTAFELAKNKLGSDKAIAYAIFDRPKGRLSITETKEAFKFLEKQYEAEFGVKGDSLAEQGFETPEVPQKNLFKATNKGRN